ncbi:hypothetical protein BDE02_03G182600 [Populus trichocarpa]|nr:hypothetical protein BDE02_03G182600 [Populus trichocarpa]
MFMASSSSLPRPGWVYDVFVSFRGQDTRKNFTDHLYTALHHARIHAFRDDEKLRRGEEISLQLSKAIQESKISIVVFSKGYASSTWCLGELQKILECRRQPTGQIVLPVFYDIDPSDIRKQTGSFAEAFDRHEARFKEEMEKVQKWRKALVEAANLSGLDRRSIANGHESKLIQKIVEEVSSILNRRNINERPLKMLKTTMISGGGLHDDAEEKQITNTAVRDWLAEYKDAVYEAEDYLDEIAYETLRQELEAETQTFINPLELKRLREIEEKSRGLQERLDDLVKQKDALGLINRTGKEPSSPKSRTTSLVDERGVYGRDDDREAVLMLLVSEDANGENPDVVPVVGMGGVGKTTLAQLVYNHRRVQKRFDLKAWVCVSEDFSVLKLTKVILEGFGSKPASDNLDQLLLKERLHGKKFLLVLDDVWNEDYAEWEKLLTPLKCGAQGSKILVTTRNESVASVMRTVPTHHLKELTEDSCWSLFAKHAFRGENPTAHEELLEIGRAIARKCKGLPLAAVTLGGLLRTKRDVEEWEKILESNLWDLPKDNILPALRLSYLYLLPQLKQCFAYCAIFPKDYLFGKDELVLLWMAEGFLVRPLDGEMERVGGECFDDLLARSFFLLSSASPSSFVMHDLIHDLATHVSGQFSFRLGENNSSMASRRTRHLSLAVRTQVTDGGFFCPELENIREAQLLRTFQTFPRYLKSLPEVYTEIFHMLSTLGRLRVLSLSRCAGAAKMLCSTSKLKHLRYLDLSRSDLVTLPEEVTSTLLNLQTLILRKCRQLASLPDLGNLKHLRHLNLEGTGIERLPASLERLINLRYLNISDTPLKEMPPHIGQLTKLQTLTDFMVGRQSETSIKELGKLRHLRGELHIRNLQNVVDARDAGEANLKGKKHLDKLRFTWDGDTHDPQHVTSTLEKLEPNRKVKDLQIDGYGGVRFPEWVGESSFSNIVSLRLVSCKNCTSLPPLGQLASLEYLSIEAFDKVVTVGSEFYGNCTAMKKPFESLKSLYFRRMPEWREWISDEGSREAFPLLEVLSIEECPNLAKALPSHHLPRVTRLKIKGCEQLATPLPRIPRLHSLSVSGFHSLESLPEEIEQMGWSLSDLGEITIKGWAALKCVALDLFPNLNYLSIYNCPDLESLCAHERPLNDLTSLHSLSISRCPKLVSFPKGGLPAPVLTRLKLKDCWNLKQLPESMHSLLPSLDHLEINGCLEFELCPEGGFPSKLQSLRIFDCNKLIAGQMLLPSSLTSLKIDSLKHLKSLDYKGLQHLTSLRALTISNCPLLESMPEEGLPSSLSTLAIYRCPMLGESCEREKGKDWPKISHIPHIIFR